MIGYPLVAIGALGYVGAIGIEVMRAVKHYFGPGAAHSYKLTLVVVTIGAACLTVGGVLAGGPDSRGLYIGAPILAAVLVVFWACGGRASCISDCNVSA